MAGARGDTAGAVSQAAAVSDPSSSVWLLACDSGSRGRSGCSPLLFPTSRGCSGGWLGSTGAVPPLWAVGCCSLAGTWIMGAHGHTVPGGGHTLSSHCKEHIECGDSAQPGHSRAWPSTLGCLGGA